MLKATKGVWKELGPEATFPDSCCNAPHHPPLPGMALNLEHDTLGFYTGAPLNQPQLKMLFWTAPFCVGFQDVASLNSASSPGRSRFKQVEK